MKEQWKWHPVYDVKVSNKGRIKSSTGNIASQNWSIAAVPYKIAQIRVKKGKYKTCRVHTLVLETWVGPRPEGMVCCHKDGDRGNNCIWNLEWNTPIHNERQKKNPARQGRSRKLSFKLASRIRQDYLTGISVIKLAKKYGVHFSTISKIINNKHYFDASWTYEWSPEHEKARHKAHTDTTRIFTQNQINKIKSEYKKGVKGRGTVALAKKYNTHHDIISRIINGKYE